MKKLYFAFILSILSICILSGCNKETSGNSGSEEIIPSNQNISDEELVDIALNISKKENNYTYWLLDSQSEEYDESDVVMLEFEYELSKGGEKITGLFDYVPTTRFDSMQDFLDSASQYLSKEYIENYLYVFLGLHPTEHLDAPLLTEVDGVLYKRLTINGVSIVPNYICVNGEVIERDETSAMVRLYVDPTMGYYYEYIDYPMILEDNMWKHNPRYT